MIRAPAAGRPGKGPLRRWGFPSGNAARPSSVSGRPGMRQMLSRRNLLCGGNGPMLFRRGASIPCIGGRKKTARGRCAWKGVPRSGKETNRNKKGKQGGRTGRNCGILKYHLFSKTDPRPLRPQGASVNRGNGVLFAFSPGDQRQPYRGAHPEHELRICADCGGAEGDRGGFPDGGTGKADAGRSNQRKCRMEDDLRDEQTEYNGNGNPDRD